MEGCRKIGEDLYQCKRCNATYCGYVPRFCSCGNELVEEESEVPLWESH